LYWDGYWLISGNLRAVKASFASVLAVIPAGESTGAALRLDFAPTRGSAHPRCEPRAGSSEKALPRSIVEMIGSPIVAGGELY
jgi:hypothetical protein